MQWIKSLVLAILLFTIASAAAFNQAALNIASYTAKDWHMKGITIGLDNVNHPTQKLVLTIAELRLPKPLADLQFVNIQCSVFTWKADEIVCQQGHAQIKTQRWQALAADFAFNLNKRNSALTLTSLKIAGGVVSVNATSVNDTWQVTADAKGLDGKQLKTYLPSLSITIQNGKANFKLIASGVASDIQQVKLDSLVSDVKANSNDGQFHVGKLSASNQLLAHNEQGIWHWQTYLQVPKGALFADPVQFEVATKPIIAEATGLWDASLNKVRVQNATVKNLKLAKGDVFVQAKMQDRRWQLAMDANDVTGQQLLGYMPKLPLQIKAGKANVKLLTSGMAADVQQVKVDVRLLGVDMQNTGGQFATEKLTLTSHLTGQNNHGVWQWQNYSQLLRGALYVDPVYLEAGSKPIVMNSKGVWNAKNRTVAVQSLNYQHPDTAALTGTSTISYGKQIQFDIADLTVTSLGLQSLFAVYLKPFFDPVIIEGIGMAGEAQGRFLLSHNTLTEAKVKFNNVALNDTRNRLRLKNGAGSVNWSNDPFSTQLSQLSWRQLLVYKLPIGATKLDLNIWAHNFRLLKPAQLPFLGGKVTVNQLSYYKIPEQEPDISFTGNITDVSLEKLSRVMQWTPLSGKISGHIPGVSYHNKTLRSGGELSINVFDGNIKLTNLASEGLFSDYPVLYGDFVLNNLDLDQITRKFSFGNITGRLSGYVKKLILENWRPTQFFAWFGTPDNDHSRHRISQKAVQNIASIGGGGATDILSRSFLSFFDTFGYDKIGFGCYLHKGVCQIMGVEAAPHGYYLIKGGGLPRIDMIGYNPQVDWQVLVDRLGRISTTDEVIVK